MPYNTSAIPRPEEVTGTSALPRTRHSTPSETALIERVARVKKIIAQDEDIAQCSNGAAFAISIATEEFLRYLTEQAYNVAKSESKPRKNIQYKDIAAAVAKLDNLQFLSDTVPRTMTYKQVKEKDKEKRVNDTAEGQPAGNSTAPSGDDAAASKQRSISSMMKNAAQGVNDTNGFSDAPSNSQPSSPTAKRISLAMTNSPIVDRTVQQPRQNGHAHPSGSDDIEMQG